MMGRKTAAKKLGSRRGRQAASQASDRDDDELELIASEEQDRNSSPSIYDILTYPADYTLKTHVEKLTAKEVLITGFQRKYVWLQPQASKLIESFLLGLPVPPVFFYLHPRTNKMLVVDGQQRLKSISYFYSGYFGEDTNGHPSVDFKLMGLSEDSPFYEKTYEDLGASSRRKLDNAVLRSFVIRQIKPKGDSAIYHIFERLNTGGTLLQGQEIRNCIFHGAFNDLLKDELNENSQWRDIFGKRQPDKRFRDIELILRFFALHYNAARYDKPMKKFLNDFMEAEQDASLKRLAEFRRLFETTTSRVRETIGSKPFHIRQGMNVAAFDAVFTAYAKYGVATTPPADIRKRFNKLLSEKKFVDCITSGTTDKDIVRTRLRLASSRLFGK
jgi:uncharacterized protein with ParB-like and HNH nuclease domain